MQEPTAEQINKYIIHFTEIYDDKGNPVNNIPENAKVTVWCDSGNFENRGFDYNTTTSEMGLNWLIAKRWILQSELEKLMFP